MIDFGLGKLWSTLILVGVVVAGLGGAYWAITDGAYKRGAASVEKQLVAAREKFEQERTAFNAKLNRIAGSIKRRCVAGEQLPECADLER